MPWAPSARHAERARPGRRRSGLGAIVALALAGVSLLAPPDVRAAATLSDGSVTPAAGTTATVFTFSVHYSNDHPFAARSVTAEIAGATSVALALVAGDADDGTWQGSSTLPGGSWPVTFVADAAQGPDPTLVGPVVVVTPLSTPIPTPIPTVPPTPVPPTPLPTLRPTPAPPPPGTAPPTAPPAPGVPAPTPEPEAPGPTFVPPAEPSPSGGIGEVRRVGGDAAPAPAASPGADRPRADSSGATSAEADPDVRDGVLSSTSDRRRGGALPWVVLGGGMSVAGALILGRQAWLRRARSA